MRQATAADARNLATLAKQVWLHTYATDGIRDAVSAHVLEELTPERFLAKIADPHRAKLVRRDAAGGGS